MLIFISSAEKFAKKLHKKVVDVVKPQSGSLGAINDGVSIQIGFLNAFEAKNFC